MIARWVEERLARADLSSPWPAATVVRRWALAGSALLVIGGVLRGTGGAVAAAVLAATPAVALRLLGGRRDRRLDAELSEALEALARSLRTGGSLVTALGDVGERTPGRVTVRGDLALVVDDLDAGIPMGDALDAWRERRPGPGVRLAVAALRLAQHGGAPARTLDRVAETRRDQAAGEREAAGLAVQARLSALVIAVAPVFFGVLSAGADPRVLGFLLDTRAGLACLVAGLALDLVGAWWMARLTAVFR